MGYRELATDLAAAHPAPTTAGDLAAIAVAYVRFALKRPGLFRVMFAEQCDATSPERVSAVAAIQEYLNRIVRRAFPSADQEAMATAVWGMVHGLAFLHLDGKLDAWSADAVADRVRAAVCAMLGASGRIAGSPATD